MSNKFEITNMQHLSRNIYEHKNNIIDKYVKYNDIEFKSLGDIKDFFNAGIHGLIILGSEHGEGMKDAESLEDFVYHYNEVCDYFNGIALKLVVVFD